jgi:hypothetical protein
MLVACERAGGTMTRFRVALLACAFSCSVMPASAATVGLGGDTVDPLAITDPAWQVLDPSHCLGLFDPSYRCAQYDGTAFLIDGIFSIDFRLKDGNAALIPFPDSITADPLSALASLAGSTLFADGFTFRLSGDPFSCIACIFFSQSDGLGANPAQVSIVGVNGVANPGATAIPEPAMLLLMGPAFAFALRHRVRRRAAARVTCG